MSNVTNEGSGDPRASAPTSEEMQYATARMLLERLNFAAWRNGWLKHRDEALYAFVDSWLSPKSQRYVGLFRHHLDETGNDMMHPIALIPWYEDGEPIEMASHMVLAVICVILDGGMR